MKSFGTREFAKFTSAIGSVYKVTQAPQIQQRVNQRLTMTPGLRQAIELLQLNNSDLCAFIDQELERNPLLEVVKPTDPVAFRTGVNSENVKQYALAANNSTSSERASFDNGPPQTGSTNVTLPEHLRQQLNFEITDPTQRAIGLYLIATVGDDG